jgi:CheY-like chemotaxis protein
MTKILVLDDELLVLETITGILQGEGYAVESGRQTEACAADRFFSGPGHPGLSFGEDVLAG